MNEGRKHFYEKNVQYMSHFEREFSSRIIHIIAKKSVEGK